MINELKELMKESRSQSWSKFGKKITFYHPGMFYYNGGLGDYPALSITGNKCQLQCDHCKGKILETMIPVSDSKDLIQKCRKLKEKGTKGLLISGGSFSDGSLPWSDFLLGIRKVKEITNLYISIHSGIIDFPTAMNLKNAGIDQALIDIIGDEKTLNDVYHCDFGLHKIKESLDALEKANIPIIPHIVIGLNYGKILGEYNAINLIKQYQVDVLIFVSLMPIKGTPMEDIIPPSPEEIAHIIAYARKNINDIPFSLGCARDRSNPKIEMYAIDCGINRLALPSDKAINKAEEYGLTIKWEKTCCSVPSSK
jgi:uncharacterized radical SAM superfamily protein